MLCSAGLCFDIIKYFSIASQAAPDDAGYRLFALGPRAIYGADDQHRRWRAGQ